MRIIPALPLALLLLAPLSARAEDKAKRVKLKKTKVTKLTKLKLRLGFGVTGTIPKEASSARLGRTQLLFLDLDGDGQLSAGSDGLAKRGLPFVVAIPKVLLMARGQWTLRFEDEALVLESAAEGLPQSILAAADPLAEIRLRAGLPLLSLDAEASSACAAHIDYLAKNNISSGPETQKETPGRPGYTEAGAHAGKNSCLSSRSPNIVDAIWSWYPTPWRGSPMLDPTVTRVGMMHGNKVAMFYPIDRGKLGAPMHHPADGAVQIPRAFGARGEFPNPVPGTDKGKGCGFPIYVTLPAHLHSKAVKVSLVPLKKSGQNWKAGRPVAGVVSTPSRPASPSWPGNSGLALFIPRKPLAARTRYRARFEFEGEETIKFTFTTGS